MLYRLICGCFFILAASACQSIKDQSDCFDCTYVHPYGVPVEGDRWVKNGCTGQKIISWRDGVTVTQAYVDGLLHGESSYSYPHSSQIERIEHYENNNLKKQVFYTWAGVPKQSVEYGPAEERTITVWYESGNPLSVETYQGQKLITGKYFNITNQQDSWVYQGDGERITRNEMGHFVSLDAFKNGELVSMTQYHPNGSPREIASYEKGVLHGERKTYYCGGEPMSIEMWDRGEQTGVTVVFQDGEKFAEVPFVNGKRNGIEKRFREGVVVQEITWKDDKMHGAVHTFCADGQIQTDWYYKGRLTSRANFESFAIPKGSKS